MTVDGVAAAFAMGGTPTPGPSTKPDPTAHQTTMVIIFVVCGAFAWLCIVKSCCALCSDDKKASHNRHDSKSVHDANELWGAIQKTPPPVRLPLDRGESGGILRRASYQAPGALDVTVNTMGDGMGRSNSGGEGNSSDEGGSDSLGNLGNTACGSAPMVISPRSAALGVTFSRTNRAKSIEGSSYQERMAGLLASNPSSLTSDHGLAERRGSDSSACSLELSPQYGSPLSKHVADARVAVVEDEPLSLDDTEERDSGGGYYALPQ